MLTKRTKVIVAALFLAFQLVYFNYENKSTVNSIDTVYKTVKIVNKPKVFASNNTGALFDNCILKELDPWDAEINKLLNYSYNPFDNCVQTVEMATKLENGKLYLLDRRDNIDCWWQCLTTETDYTLIRGPWKKLVSGDVPQCDIIETRCRQKQVQDAATLMPDDEEFKNTMYYNFLHAQVYRNDATLGFDKDYGPKSPPDVHIFLTDSVSHSHSIRGMPQTRRYLRENFDAVSFPYLNKVGLNSRPNAFAFLMGKTVFDIRKSPISVGYRHDCHQNWTCCQLLENRDFISFLYHDAGYKTMMSEDYMHTVFSSGPCYGFNSTPVDHYMRPYQLRVDFENYTTPLLQESVYNGMCRDSFVPQFEYLKEFIEKYPDKPKFTITWMTKLAHDDNNALFHADDYFYNFFRNNSEKLNNSYMFVMADHGTRYGLTRLTGAGEREDNNPFFLMSLPASLRGDDELRTVVGNNTLQLVSHYDIYATFVDIVAPHRPHNTAPKLYGSSILKPLPQPRSCDRLRIPFEYCICDYPRSKMPDDSAPGRKAATLMVQTMNRVITKSPTLNEFCQPLALADDPVAVESFKVEGNLAIHKITYKVVPGDGQFFGYVSQNVRTGKLSLLSSRLPRLNSYAKTAYCVKNDDFAAFCYCKDIDAIPTLLKPFSFIRNLFG